MPKACLTIFNRPRTLGLAGRSIPGCTVDIVFLAKMTVLGAVIAAVTAFVAMTFSDFSFWKCSGGRSEFWSTQHFALRLQLFDGYSWPVCETAFAETSKSTVLNVCCIVPHDGGWLFFQGDRGPSLLSVRIIFLQWQEAWQGGRMLINKERIALLWHQNCNRISKVLCWDGKVFVVIRGRWLRIWGLTTVPVEQLKCHHQPRSRWQRLCRAHFLYFWAALGSCFRLSRALSLFYVLAAAAWLGCKPPCGWQTQSILQAGQRSLMMFMVMKRSILLRAPVWGHAMSNCSISSLHWDPQTTNSSKRQCLLSALFQSHFGVPDWCHTQRLCKPEYLNVNFGRYNCG